MQVSGSVASLCGLCFRSSELISLSVEPYLVSLAPRLGLNLSWHVAAALGPSFLVRCRECDDCLLCITQGRNGAPQPPHSCLPRGSTGTWLSENAPGLASLLSATLDHLWLSGDRSAGGTLGSPVPTWVLEGFP